MIVIANCDQDQVAGKRHEQDPQIESGSELEELPEGSQPDARVQMRPAKGRFEPSDGMVHSGLLLGRQFLESPIIRRPGEDHLAQGLSLPVAFSLAISFNVRSAARSTSSGVTPYSSNGLGGPTKKFQAAS